MSNRAINECAYSVACERQKSFGDLPETTAFKRYAAKHERKSQLLITLAYPWSASSARRTAKRQSYPAIVNDIHPCPKRCLLMPLARVGARTTSTATNARRGQFPRMRIGVILKMMRLHLGLSLPRIVVYAQSSFAREQNLACHYLK